MMSYTIPSVCMANFCFSFSKAWYLCFQSSISLINCCFSSGYSVEQFNWLEFFLKFHHQKYVSLFLPFPQPTSQLACVDPNCSMHYLLSKIKYHARTRFKINIHACEPWYCSFVTGIFSKLALHAVRVGFPICCSAVKTFVISCKLSVMLNRRFMGEDWPWIGAKLLLTCFRRMLEILWSKTTRKQWGKN